MRKSGRHQKKKNERKREHQRSTCQYKVAYSSYEEAFIISKQHNQKAYRCPVCKLYHLATW